MNNTLIFLEIFLIECCTVQPRSQELYPGLVKVLGTRLLYCGTTYDVITFFIFIIQNVHISNTKKDIPKRKPPFFNTLKRLSNKQQLLLFFTS